jgi:demethoxyubiquinone hydroxylase (CLK1/Coq7/Cat5 family)
MPIARRFQCSFSNDALCSSKKCAGFVFMGRCLKCRHYRRFMREMEEDDERLMDEIDRMRKEGYE